MERLRPRVGETPALRRLFFGLFREAQTSESQAEGNDNEGGQRPEGETLHLKTFKRSELRFVEYARTTISGLKEEGS